VVRVLLCYKKTKISKTTTKTEAKPKTNQAKAMQTKTKAQYI
jgi:hypothetical protein